MQRDVRDAARDWGIPKRCHVACNSSYEKTIGVGERLIRAETRRRKVLMWHLLKLGHAGAIRCCMGAGGHREITKRRIVTSCQTKTVLTSPGVPGIEQPWSRAAVAWPLWTLREKSCLLGPAIPYHTLKKRQIFGLDLPDDNPHKA